MQVFRRENRWLEFTRIEHFCQPELAKCNRYMLESGRIVPSDSTSTMLYVISGLISALGDRRHDVDTGTERVDQLLQGRLKTSEGTRISGPNRVYVDQCR